MKKYIIILFIASVVLTACNPNKEIYEELDLQYDIPYSETGMKYTLTSEDYEIAADAAEAIATNEEDSTWANYIKKYNSFNDKYSANDYMDAILSENFPALNEKSSILANYNQYIGQMYGDIKTSEFSSSDYTAIEDTVFIGNDTIVIADTLCFTQYHNPDGFVKNYLTTKYPSATENTYAEVFYQYPDIDTQTGSFYMFDGSTWTLVENTYVLAESDYENMGEPGSHHNFSESTPPGDYLPQFLNMKNPYAQKGEKKIVVCDLFKYETSVYAITCEYDGSNWQIYFPGQEITSQFIHTGERWLFDPTVRFTMSAEDYGLIVEEDPIPYYKPEKPGGMYYGASIYYRNFHIGLVARIFHDPDTYENMPEDEAHALIQVRLREGLQIMLKKKFPDAVPNIEGLDVHYFITYKIYDGIESRYYEIEYKCTASGTPPEFEIVTDAIDVTY